MDGLPKLAFKNKDEYVKDVNQETIRQIHIILGQRSEDKNLPPPQELEI